MKIKRTERGWAGHFICADRCMFRRNTLLQYGKKYVVVSTVGNMVMGNGKAESIGSANRMYETMAFMSNPADTLYRDIVVSEQVYAPEGTKWSIDRLEHETDAEANDMHENYVAAIEKMLINKEI